MFLYLWKSFHFVNLSGCPVLEDQTEDIVESASPSPTSSTENCEAVCVSDYDCADDELCCGTQCGGSTCYNPGLMAKFRSEEIVEEDPAADATTKKRRRKKKHRGYRKCAMADKFMQCMYETLSEEVCNEQ